MKLKESQLKAVEKMFTGCILNGSTGSGKTLTSLYYFFTKYGGKIDDEYKPMVNPPDLYVITTAAVRDKLSWDKEMAAFLMSPNPALHKQSNKVVIDSWNNIKKYKNVTNAFFIFDEDRVTGKGEWARAFIRIAKHNEWIILSATPGDKWEDYEAVFVANGFYRNRSEMRDAHFEYHRKIPGVVVKYWNVGRLNRLRRKILIDMDVDRTTTQIHEDVWCSYNILDYNDVFKNRWNIYDNLPIDNVAELCYLLRKVVNSDESRQTALLELLEKHPKAIIFYNFDYELDILKNLYYGEGVEIAQWNGHAHEALPTGDKWVYLVQYTAGCEGWNCITTDTIIFYSQNYSYRTVSQATGRIDRLNTPYHNLYYYHLKSRAKIDLAISLALKRKKKFNEGKFISW